MSFFESIARPLTERGFAVIPLQPNSKEPVSGIGAKNRSWYPETIEGWAEQWPDANVGICADKRFVILESDDEVRFREVVRAATGKELPITLTSGARHNRPHWIYEATPYALETGNIQVGGLFEGRFVNTYVVGPGSRHPSGALYRFVNDYKPIPIPDWLVDALKYLKGNSKLTPSPVNIDLAGETVFGPGERHYALTSAAGKLWDGKKTEQQLFAELWAINVKRCDPPKEEGHVRSIARHYINEREPFNPGPTVTIGGKEVQTEKFGPRSFRAADPDPYIVQGTEKLEGWFIKQELNLAVGASGTGKTTIMLQILEAIRRGDPVFGHPTRKCEYRVLMHDRSARGFERTAKRMRLTRESRERIYRLTRAEQRGNAVDVLDQYLKKQERYGAIPDIILVEGLDFWEHEDINKKAVVENYCSNLIELAELWDVAIVGSVGCPKQKAKDKYQQSRDNINGSAAWGRKVETVLFVMLSNPENPNSTRKMEVLPRNGPAEIFHLAFKEGQLVEAPPETEEKETPLKGVNQTKTTLKTDKLKELIEYLETLPLGRVLKSKDLAYYGSDSTITRYLQELAHPSRGWVGKNDKHEWIVTKTNNKEEN